MRERSTRLIWPFSSETTTTTASVCSAIPRAARWRVPNRSAWTVVSASGSRRAGGQDRLAADDDRAVVERGARREDRAQQVGRDVAVDHHPGLGDLLEAGLALEDDERAVAVRGQVRGGPGHLVGDMVDRPRVGRRQEPGERADPADAVEARGGSRAGR